VKFISVGVTDGGIKVGVFVASCDNAITPPGESKKNPTKREPIIPINTFFAFTL
jgi:hypothetical protein